MPAIESLVAGWREAVAPLFGGREDALDELVSHLREAIDRRAACGDSPDAAFRSATAALGPPDVVAAEIAKVPAVPLPWLPATTARWAASALEVAATGLLAPRLARGGLDAVLASHVLLGYLAALLAACFLVGRLFRPPQEGHAATARRAATLLTASALYLTAAGIVLGCACPFDKAGWCWGLDTREVGGIGVAAWNAALLAWAVLGRRDVSPSP